MLPPTFKYWFQFCYNIHQYSPLPIYIKHLSGQIILQNFLSLSAVDSWNKMQDQMREAAL